MIDFIYKLLTIAFVSYACLGLTHASFIRNGNNNIYTDSSGSFTEGYYYDEMLEYMEVPEVKNFFDSYIYNKNLNRISIIQEEDEKKIGKMEKFMFIKSKAYNGKVLFFKNNKYHELNTNISNHIDNPYVKLFPYLNIANDIYMKSTNRLSLILGNQIDDPKYYFFKREDLAVSHVKQVDYAELVDIFITLTTIANNLALRGFKMADSFECFYFITDPKTFKKVIRFDASNKCVADSGSLDFSDVAVSNLIIVGLYLEDIFRLRTNRKNRFESDHKRRTLLFYHQASSIKVKLAAFEIDRLRLNAIRCAVRRKDCEYRLYPLFPIILEFIADSILSSRGSLIEGYRSYVALPYYLFDKVILGYHAEGFEQFNLEDPNEKLNLISDVFGARYLFFAPKSVTVCPLNTLRTLYTRSDPIVYHDEDLLENYKKLITSYNEIVTEAPSDERKHFMKVIDTSISEFGSNRLAIVNVLDPLMPGKSNMGQPIIRNYGLYGFDVVDGEAFFLFPKIMKGLHYLYDNGFTYLLPLGFLERNHHNNVLFLTSGDYINKTDVSSLDDKTYVGATYLFDISINDFIIVPSTYERVGQPIQCALFDTPKQDVNSYKQYAEKATVFCLGLDYVRRRAFYRSQLKRWNTFINIWFNAGNDKVLKNKKNKEHIFNEAFQKLYTEHKFEELEIDLLKKMLDINPDTRISLLEASEHKFWKVCKERSVLT